MMKVRGLIDRGEFSITLDLMQPYIPYPARFPALYSDYLVILVWADRREEAVERFESLPAEDQTGFLTGQIFQPKEGKS